jgi:hypothetical protein
MRAVHVAPGCRRPAGRRIPYGRQLATWNFESQYVTNSKIGGYGVQTIPSGRSSIRRSLKYGKLAGLTDSNKIPPARVGSGHEARRRSLPRQDADLARNVRVVAGNDRDPAPPHVGGAGSRIR